MDSKPNRKIRTLDMRIIDSVFCMEGGYVLDFSNRTFADFFLEELNVNIDDPRWAVEGTSKAKRLRFLLKNSDPQFALLVLRALWEYREMSNFSANYPPFDESVRTNFNRILSRLEGKSPDTVVTSSSNEEKNIDSSTASTLAVRLIEISDMDPHPRGYAFEKFLKDLFDGYGMSARASFRLTGEQIDGSFVLGDQTYLLEARWRNERVQVETLRAFNAKVEHKSKWTRGLIICQSGFTPEGLKAFGTGKSVICMNGFDLHEVLSRSLDLATVIRLKERHAAETGETFIQVRDLNISPH